MHFTKVDPNAVKPKTKLDRELDEFMRMDVEMVKCHFEPGRYKSVQVAYTTWYKAIRHWGYPVKAIVANGELYLKRTDM